MTWKSPEISLPHTHASVQGLGWKGKKTQSLCPEPKDPGTFRPPIGEDENEVQSVEGELRSLSEGLRPGRPLKGDSHVRPPFSWIPSGDGLGAFQVRAHSQGQSREVRTSLPNPLGQHRICPRSSALLWLVPSFKCPGNFYSIPATESNTKAKTPSPVYIRLPGDCSLITSETILSQGLYVQGCLPRYSNLCGYPEAPGSSFETALGAISKRSLALKQNPGNT